MFWLLYSTYRQLFIDLRSIWFYICLSQMEAHKFWTSSCLVVQAQKSAQAVWRSWRYTTYQFLLWNRDRKPRKANRSQLKYPWHNVCFMGKACKVKLSYSDFKTVKACCDMVSIACDMLLVKLGLHMSTHGVVVGGFVDIANWNYVDFFRNLIINQPFSLLCLLEEICKTELYGLFQKMFSFHKKHREKCKQVTK